MTKFNPSKMKLISRTAMARFNSIGDTVGYSAGVQTSGPLSRGIASASLAPRSEQGNGSGDLGPPVSGCKNILPAAACYSSLAKLRIDGNFDGVMKPNPFSFGGQTGARNYAAGSVGVDQSRVGLWTRPLSPHLTIYYPQSNSTASIINRMTGIYLTAAVLAPYLLCMKVGTVAFSYDYVYQFFFYSSYLGPLSAELAALALGYHVYKGIGHLVADVTGSVRNVKKH